VKRTSCSLIVVLLGGLLLASCGGSPTELPVPSPLPVLTGQASGLTIVDALGRATQLPELPQRIVVAGKSTLTIVDTLYMFPEAQERIVALVVGRQPVGDFLRFVDPTFGDKTILEVEAGPEQIAPLDPDLVILRSSMAEKLGRSLEQLDIPVVYVDLETPDQYFRDLDTLGQLFGDAARASEIQSFYRSRLERIAEPLRGLGDDQKPRILILQFSEQGGEVAFQVPAAAWMQTTEAKLAGGIPVWTDAAQGGGWTVVNLEQIAAWDPDQIFVISYEADSADIVEWLEAEPQWQVLKAVKERRIYGFAADTFSWDQPDPRWVLGVIWLAGKVHPDRFPDLDVRQEVSQFFEQLYGMESVAVEEHILSNLKGDVR
jgi:iron complex transport system substrate-binding protein